MFRENSFSALIVNATKVAKSSTCTEWSITRSHATAGLIAAGFPPRLIVAACVGFVGAAEVKERVLRGDVPAIVVRGRRGGSGVAAAIANSLLLLARYGWR